MAPSLVRTATGSTSNLIGGATVAVLTVTGALMVAGCGFGAGFLGALRSVVPLALPHERAGLMSAFYVLSYLAFCLPSLLAGNLTRTFGLVATTDGYGAVLIILSVGALLTSAVRESLWRRCAMTASLGAAIHFDGPTHENHPQQRLHR